MRISDWSSDVCSSDLPGGTWKTIDDATGKAKSLVTIREDDGTLHGKVVKLFNPSKPNPTCEKCEGKRKDQPIMGMEILWGLKKDDGQWDGGQILDTEKGKVYGAKMSFADDGKTPHVRRTAERRVGQECARTCRSRWSREHET